MINKKLEDFVRHYTKYPAPIREKTELVKDLMINEDIAPDFFAKYADAFNVDISDFDIREYFSYNDKKDTLTVGDLERGAVLGLLNDDIVKFTYGDQQLPPRFSLRNILSGILLLIIITGILAFVAFYL